MLARNILPIGTSGGTWDRPRRPVFKNARSGDTEREPGTLFHLFHEHRVSTSAHEIRSTLYPRRKSNPAIPAAPDTQAPK
ncbi:hypothetical protein M407DRAFT_241786 [Tulasnella calospora MUT 4182]|uniref:Uncharacterized protein n=1 Tax=Tulasnella calospora MUT 4182 TaxID=1051891 RepID=A0A0C3QHN4_9AGAM|nr:hypothetical protein M407DRAFT_241786 [Tulasnella calospora MUT 4182]